jgi:hypothetical protein
MILNFHPRIKSDKGHEVDLTCQIQRPPRSGFWGKLLHHDEKIAFVVQTF